MSQQVVAGASFILSNSQNYGSINSTAMGDSFSMQVQQGTAEVTVSLMFLINGEKNYSTIIVNSTVHTQPIPAGTTYLEFGIQAATVTGDTVGFRINILQNS